MSTMAQLVAAFFVLCVFGALIACLIPARWNPVVLAAIASLAAVIILLASSLLLVTEASFHATLWPVLSLATMRLAADRLSALFLFVTGLVLLPVSIFSGIYLIKYKAHYSLRYFSILYHGLFASIVLVLIADVKHATRAGK